MIKNDTRVILEASATTLERMAFLSVEPVEGRQPVPIEAVLVRVRLWRPEPAAVEIIAPRKLGALIAANAMAITEVETVSAEQAHDALAEFLNILASALLPESATRSAGQIVKGVPEVMPLTGEKDWEDFAADPEAVFFGAEGCVVACRLVIGTKP